MGVLAASCALVLALPGCNGGEVTATGHDGGATADNGVPPGCPDGVDADGDGYGQGCPAGDDCDDSDPAINPAAKESCDGIDNDCDGEVDEGVLNVCGTCDPGCSGIGNPNPFPVDPSADPSVKKVDGVGLDGNGDLVLTPDQKSFNFLWIANTFDTAGSGKGCIYANNAKYDPTLDAYCRGTVSKVDTVKLKEVGRYFTVTCNSNPGTSGCVDVNGKPIDKIFPHAPSRTAVDYNGDVWVANRAFGGQPSATKIANDPADCIDRNGNGTIDTSKDQNGDGKITVDCDGNGTPDGFGTKCTGAMAGMPPEFLGDDDECILFTTNYADKADIGRSICLDAGKSVIGASNAWVGTFNRPANGHGNNRFYKINGYTGKIEASVELPAGHSSYGCTADGYNVIWSTHGKGTLAFFSALAPYPVGPLLTSPKTSLVANPAGYHYGIATDAKGHIWLGGTHSCRVLRYKPDRTDFSSLSGGSWTVIHIPCPGTTAGSTTTVRGIAPDLRGKVWTALTSGYIVRVDQSLSDGVHDLSKSKDIWKLTANGVIGVGVDLAGHVWGIGHSNSTASRIDVDAQGDVIQPYTGQTNNVAVGHNPYTYSDFTGYGLINFIRPQGRYVYQLAPCQPGHRARWKKVVWSATTPPNTGVAVRVRSGDTETTMGGWFGPFTSSPAELEASVPPLSPNPAILLEVELTLTTQDKTVSPTVHDLSLVFDCTQAPF
jgi:hypothetical protein